MENKLCTKCSMIKPINEFGKSKASPNGYSYWCRSCVSKRHKVWKRTKNGVMCMIYNAQKGNSKDRGHKPPEYTFDEFRDWLLSQENWELLYENWVVSGYKKNMRPSCDRLNNNHGYSIRNIKLTTWIENKEREFKDHKAGRLMSNYTYQPVIQLTQAGDYINSFHSMMEANRQTGIDQGSISRVCAGDSHSAGGYKWEYNKNRPL